MTIEVFAIPEGFPGWGKQLLEELARPPAEQIRHAHGLTLSRPLSSGFYGPCEAGPHRVYLFPVIDPQFRVGCVVCERVWRVGWDDELAGHDIDEILSAIADVVAVLPCAP